MGVREGYKQTEVGIIPGVWKVERFSDICELINGRGFKPYEWRLEGLLIIRIQNLDGSDDFNYYQGPFDQKILVQNQQLLFAWSGSRGTSFGPHIWKGGDALLNYHTWKLRIKSSELDHSFFLHKLREITKQIEEESHGASALVHTQKGEVEAFILSLPPLPEQKAIAAALSDTDELIAGLEALVAKKQAIKQGAMQQLLTGRKRLPGFEGEWEVKRFEDVMTGFSSGATPYRGTANYYNGDINWITSGELNYERIYETKEKITRKALEDTNLHLLPEGAFLIAITGLEAAGTRGSCGIVGKPSTTNQSCMALFPKTNLYLDFLFHFYRLYGDELAFEYCQGTKQQSYTGSIVRTLPICIPPSIAEQQAIAAVLSDMDAEIESLQTQLGKTRALKQGMMQELLTGRIRLV